MPTFFRKSTPSKRPIAQRKFVVPKAKKSKSTRSKVKEADVVIKEAVPPIPTKPDKTLNVLDDLLKTPDNSLNQRNENKVVENQNAVYQDDTEPDDFNGISNTGEQKEYFGSVIEYERKKAEAVEEQIKLLEKEKETEKRELQKEIRSLKEELHRTNPIHDNKFFSLSKELREAITEIEHLALENGVVADQGAVAVTQPTATEIPAAAAVVTSEPPQPVLSQPPVVSPPKIVQNPTQAAATEPEEPQGEKKSLSKKKLLITGASATAILILISGIMASSMTGKAKVNPKIVNSYLQSQPGQVAGAQTATVSQTPESDPSQAAVSFEQSVWEEFKDASFGIMLQFPKNAVKAIRTDSNVTFIRKTGYLFKVQRIQTALTIQEYWKQIQATSLNYKMSEDKFKGMPAIKLELVDVTDYPGDRFLVKQGEFIYDIWHATPSNNFEKDDISRAEKMLASLSIIGIIQ